MIQDDAPVTGAEAGRAVRHKRDRRRWRWLNLG